MLRAALLWEQCWCWWGPSTQAGFLEEVVFRRRPTSLCLMAQDRAFQAEEREAHVDLEETKGITQTVT